MDWDADGYHRGQVLDTANEILGGISEFLDAYNDKELSEVMDMQSWMFITLLAGHLGQLPKDVRDRYAARLWSEATTIAELYPDQGEMIENNPQCRDELLGLFHSTLEADH